MTKDLLDGKVVVITGAGRGIGRAIATAYGQAGARVVCTARTQSEVDETALAIQEAGGRAIGISTDVTCETSVKALFETAIENYQRLDILVIGAGCNLDRRTVEDSVTDDWRSTMETNLFGAYYCAKAAIPFMKQRGGKIITIGSGLGHKGAQKRSAYSCSKAAMWMLTRVLAQELCNYNISVNELIPGPVSTALNSPDHPDKDGVSSVASEWLKTPDDVVPMALFLASQPLVGPTAQSFSLMRRDNGN